VIVLRGRREEQAVGAREPTNGLVLAVQVLAEVEAVSFALKPHLLAPMRPGMKPLFLDARRTQDEAIAKAHPAHEEVHLVE